MPGSALRSGRHIAGRRLWSQRLLGKSVDAALRRTDAVGSSRN